MKNPEKFDDLIAARTSLQEAESAYEAAIALSHEAEAAHKTATERLEMAKGYMKKVLAAHKVKVAYL